MLFMKQMIIIQNHLQLRYMNQEYKKLLLNANGYNQFTVEKLVKMVIILN